MILKTLIMVSAGLALNCFAATPAPPEAPIEIISAEFGIFEQNTPNELVFEPANVVPHKQGQRYGWVIEVRTAKRTLSVREEYLIATPPKAPDNKNALDESLSLPAQRRNQVSQRQLVPVEGRIYGEWSIGPNEPAGHRHLHVVVEGQSAAHFEYDVK
jgi:hypothetical protein